MKLYWKIYYADDSTFSNLEGSPSEAPSWGVQDIIQIDPEKGKYHQSGSDFYIFRNDFWYGVDWIGLLDFLLQLGIVKMGRTVPTSKFLEIRSRAESDPGFPSRGKMND